MAFYHRYTDGYTRGGIDVESALSNFFKFVLLSPILLGALQLSAIMLKHFIFNGVPSLNRPSEAQQTQLRERDQQVSPPPVVQAPAPNDPIQPRPTKEQDVLRVTSFLVSSASDPTQNCRQWWMGEEATEVNVRTTGYCWSFLK